MLGSVVIAEKAIKTSKQAKNFREDVKCLEMADSMSRVLQQAVSMPRDQRQPVEGGGKASRYHKAVKGLDMVSSISRSQWQAVSMPRAHQQLVGVGKYLRGKINDTLFTCI